MICSLFVETITYYITRYVVLLFICFFSCSRVHRYLHVLTHSFPTRLSSELGAPGSVAPLHAPLDWLRETMAKAGNHFAELDAAAESLAGELGDDPDRKSTRLNSSH